MHYILIIFMTLFTHSVFAQLKIEKIVDEQDKLSLYLENGEIVQVLKKEKEDIEAANLAKSLGHAIEFERSEQNTNSPDLIYDIKIIKIESSEVAKELYTPAAFNRLRFTSRDPLENSKITLLPTYQKAQEVMDLLNGKTDKDSQCYNRAHMWTYETLAKSKVTLGKVWIFFTRKYIKEFNYKWWFHVAPYSHVNDGNKLYVLDRGFRRIPYNLESWKNIFMKNKANCPMIKNYNDYRSNQHNEYCYLVKSSQYYWQPRELEHLANTGQVKWGYRTSELKTAYPDALISWDDIIPRLSSDTDTSTNTGDEREEETDISDDKTDNSLLFKSIVKWGRRIFRSELEAKSFARSISKEQNPSAYFEQYKEVFTWAYQAGINSVVSVDDWVRDFLKKADKMVGNYGYKTHYLAVYKELFVWAFPSGVLKFPREAAVKWADNFMKDLQKVFHVSHIERYKEFFLWASSYGTLKLSRKKADEWAREVMSKKKPDLYYDCFLEIYNANDRNFFKTEAAIKAGKCQDIK